MTERKINKKEVARVNLDGLTLEEAIHHLTDLSSSHGGNALISTECYKYGSDNYLALYAFIPETDAEISHRCNIEQRNQIEKDIRERKEFERLKAKFAASGVKV